MDERSRATHSCSIWTPIGTKLNAHGFVIFFATSSSGQNVFALSRRVTKSEGWGEHNYNSNHITERQSHLNTSKMIFILIFCFYYYYHCHHIHYCWCCCYYYIIIMTIIDNSWLKVEVSKVISEDLLQASMKKNHQPQKKQQILKNNNKISQTRLAWWECFSLW